MKPLTEKQRQWCWFIALWAGGLITLATLTQVFRWLIRLG
jgi:uncharacterized membrane protein